MNLLIRSPTSTTLWSTFVKFVQMEIILVETVQGGDHLYKVRPRSFQSYLWWHPYGYGRKLCHFIFCSHDPVEIHLLSSALKFSQQPICLCFDMYSPVDKINNIKHTGYNLHDSGPWQYSGWSAGAKKQTSTYSSCGAPIVLILIKFVQYSSTAFFLKNLCQLFWQARTEHYALVKSTTIIFFSNFVAFLENPNFTHATKKKPFSFLKFIKGCFENLVHLERYI